ncbi:effector-associated domain EAD1-containing protein [Frankia sp. QA3]|uniref:effector-associated domain EAD1-containing protein n=1 Tax=Frankia sp. QA3 TaxID=710111 RepID=UPI000269CD29|nr:effector-associated domain EAD1-containing protein [Frankia sp. QA3]EIV96100.1 hypothetical protein FraQA3DRAFT_5962 [Frankia sp. QA3]
MTQRLSEVEIKALARAFYTRAKATRLLERAGLARDLMPAFIGSPYEAWSEIAAQLEDGLLVNGRARVLAAAAVAFPGSEVFGGDHGLSSPLGLDSPLDFVPAERGRKRPPAGMPEHVSLFFIDARRYSGRSLLGQVGWRAALREIVAAAVEGLRLPAESIRLLQDHGDGFLGAVAGSVAKVYLASDFVRELQIAQRAYNDGRDPDSRLRLRMSLHHGDVIVDGTGAPGDAVVVAARLIEAPQVRGLLERYPDADLVLALSPEYFRNTAAERLRDLDPAKFREIDVSVGDKYAGTAWVTLPGHEANPPLDEDPADPQPVDAPAGARPADGMPFGTAAAPASKGTRAMGRLAADEVRRRIEDFQRGRKHSASPPPFPGRRA